MDKNLISLCKKCVHVGFISGVKKMKKPVYDSTKKIGLTSKKIIEHSSASGARVKPIHDRNFTGRISKSIYTKPKNFIDFEGGIIKNTQRAFNRPKSFLDFNASF